MIKVPSRFLTWSFPPGAAQLGRLWTWCVPRSRTDDLPWTVPSSWNGTQPMLLENKLQPLPGMFMCGSVGSREATSNTETVRLISPDDVYQAHGAHQPCRIRRSAFGTPDRSMRCGVHRAPHHISSELSWLPWTLPFANRTSKASAYLEGMWVWTADHDLDDSQQRQVSKYLGWS